MYLAWRNILTDRARMFLCITGVALAVMLILVLNGFLDGLYLQITSYLDNSPASIVVAEEDVTNLLGVTSVLPEGAGARVESLRGVEAAIPILTQFLILDLHDKKQPVYLLGYEPGRSGGPWNMESGREPRRKSEIVIDAILAQRHGFALDQTIEVLGKDFRIVGLSRGATSWMTSFVFLEKKTAETLLRMPGKTSFLLVRTAEQTDLRELTGRINRISGVTAQPKDQMAANDIRLFARVFSAPLRLMVITAFMVGTLIIGLVVYTITTERQREFGVLKAIGASNGALYRVVLAQAALAAVLGAALGILLAYAVSDWIMSQRAQFLIHIDARMVSLAFLAGLGMALAAALLPARLVAGLAPAEVFRR